MRALALLLPLLFGTSTMASGQQASFHLFGTGGGTYSGGVVELEASSLPRLGQTFSLRIGSPTLLCTLNGGQYVYQHIAFGISNRSWAGLPMPFDVEGIEVPVPCRGGPGAPSTCREIRTLRGQVLISLDANLWPYAAGTGQCDSVLHVPIPNSPALLGAVLFAQGWEIGGTGSGSEYQAFSPAGRITIGS